MVIFLFLKANWLLFSAYFGTIGSALTVLTRPYQLVSNFQRTVRTEPSIQMWNFVIMWFVKLSETEMGFNENTTSRVSPCQSVNKIWPTLFLNFTPPAKLLLFNNYKSFYLFLILFSSFFCSSFYLPRFYYIAAQKGENSSAPNAKTTLHCTQGLTKTRSPSSSSSSWFFFFFSFILIQYLLCSSGTQSCSVTFVCPTVYIMIISGSLWIW